MSQRKPSARERIGLACVDPPGFDANLVAALATAGARATFFVRPEILVLDAVHWRFAVAAGHELGDGSFLGATDDGRLPLWTCPAIEDEFRSTERLLRELGQDPVRSTYLPGRFHRCAEGRYRRHVQARFDVCIGETQRSLSLGGRPGSLEVFDPRVPQRGTAAFSLLSPTAGAVREFFVDSPNIEALPLCELIEQNPHT